MQDLKQPLTQESGFASMKAMIKTIIRSIVFNSTALFLLSLTFTGLKINGGFGNLLLAGVSLSLISLLAKPILNIISLPFNLITFGLFSFITNAIILYLLTVFYPSVSIASFTFKGFSFVGFVVPVIYFNTFFAFVFLAFGLSLILSFLKWLTQ